MDNMNIMPEEEKKHTIAVRIPETVYNEFKSRLLKKKMGIKEFFLYAMDKYMGENHEE